MTEPEYVATAKLKDGSILEKRGVIAECVSWAVEKLEEGSNDVRVVCVSK